MDKDFLIRKSEALESIATITLEILSVISRAERNVGFSVTLDKAAAIPLYQLPRNFEQILDFLRFCAQEKNLNGPSLPLL